MRSRSVLRRRLAMRLGPVTIVHVPVWAYLIGTLALALLSALWVYAEGRGHDWIGTGIGVTFGLLFVGLVLFLGFSDDGGR